MGSVSTDLSIRRRLRSVRVASFASAAPVVIEALPNVRPRARRVAIGNFDGVHLGHAEIIRGCDTVLTFAPHPLAVVAPDRAPKLLTNLAAKAACAGRLGVRELVVLPFDRVAAAQSPEAFVDEVLVRTLGAVHVSVGENFRYGARAAGDVGSLAECGRFTVNAGGLLELDGEVVSSTRVREAIAAGDLPGAARLLGRPHRLTAHLAGSELTFDAAQACPPPGAYLCRVKRPGIASPRVGGVVHVLRRPARRSGVVHARLTGYARSRDECELSVEFLDRWDVPGAVVPGEADRLHGVA